MNGANLSKIFASPNDKLNKILEQLALSKSGNLDLPPGIVLVVDEQTRLLGLVTNGDMRRAFEAKISLEEPVSAAMNRQPSFIVSSSGTHEVLPMLFDKIRAGQWPKNRLEKIIVLNEKHQVIDLVSFYDLVKSSDVRFKHIGVVGLGFVGLTLGLTLADLGFKVKGLDANKKITSMIKSKKSPFFEDGLPELLEDHVGKNFSMVDDFSGANNCDVYFVAVGTPLDKNNKPSLAYIESAAKSLGKVLKHGDVVILRSTVPVGTTREIVIPILEKESGISAGDGFLVSFAPERTIEGKALEELRRLPQIIGGINRASCDMVSSIFSFLTNSIVLVDSLEAAELVKLINNTYRDVTFGFANEVSLVAQKWGIDTKKMIESANYGYKRSNIPVPSPGVGGYCLEKDPYIFAESARRKGYAVSLSKHSRKVNTDIINSTSQNIISFLKKHKKNVARPKILTLGVAFKGNPVTSDVRGSTAIKLIQNLQKARFSNVHVYDPAVSRADITKHNVTHVTDLKKGFKGADAVLVMNNNPAFETIKIRNMLKLAGSPVLLFDGWAVFNSDEVSKVKNVHYKRL